MKDFLLKLLNDPDKFNKFIKFSTEEELYEFCVQNGAEFSREEFKEIVKQSMDKFKKETKLEEVKDLDSVAGGKKESERFNNFLALAMAALSIGGMFTPAINATEVRKVPGKKTKQVLKNSDSKFEKWANWALTGLGLSAVPLALIYYLSKSNEASLNVGGWMKNNPFLRYKNNILQRPSAESNTSILEEENNNLTPPFSGISNHKENRCLQRCYINAYVQVLYEIPEFKEYVEDMMNNNKIFFRLNNVFKKMDNREPIKYDDEDYNEFCKLLDHEGQQDDFLNLFDSQVDFQLINMYYYSSSNKAGFGFAYDKNNTVFVPFNENCEISLTPGVKNKSLMRDKSFMVNIIRGDYDQSTSRMVKNTNPVYIPKTLKNTYGNDFKLTCMVLHHGNGDSYGHYTTVKRDEQGNWWHCDDESVRPANDGYLPDGDYARRNAVYLYYRADD